MTILTAQCICGAIKYEITGKLDVYPVYNCHCSLCRRWGGDAFRTSTLVRSKDFHWISGENKLSKYDYKGKAFKTFCSKCGTNLISTYPSRPEVFGISLGGLDQDPGVKPAAHIFVDSKAPWHDLDDDIPRYDERPTNN